MDFQNVQVARLQVNPANDRHGERRDEDAAISELFHLHDPRMRQLTRDIVAAGRIYDPPLVMLHNEDYVVFDGNRRVACLKLLNSPQRAPSDDLVQFFRSQRLLWQGAFPTRITCQVETDRDVVDAILFRRHTGTQGGIGQIDWDAKAKTNFVERTGRGGQVNLGASVEELLRRESRLPADRIPWSTLVRLLSSEQFRGRVGISIAGREFRLTHQREAALQALERITNDLASGHLTLGHLWNNEGKRRYLDGLEAEGLLPTEQHRLPQDDQPAEPRLGPRRGRPPRQVPPSRTFIPNGVPPIQWTANQHRVASIWNELSSLPMNAHPNAVAALVRMLIEFAVEGYLDEHGLQERPELSRRVGAVARSLRARDLIDQKYFEEIERIRRDDALISIASMQRLLHSPDFAPMEAEFRTYWNRLSRFLVAALAL